MTVLDFNDLFSTLLSRPFLKIVSYVKTLAHDIDPKGLWVGFLKHSYIKC